ALDTLARAPPLITLENEFVDAQVLDALEARGARVLPRPSSVAIVQDKLLQKQALERAGLPVPRFAAVDDTADVVRVGEQLGWPLMLKARRDGYDGRGNRLVSRPSEGEAALGALRASLLAEAHVPFVRELAVQVVRAADGATVVYPTVETRQDPALHICRVVLAPAEVPAAVAEEASYIARRAVEAVDGVGAFGVELFLLEGGRICVNELAPRPHNSAHYSIEGCVTSQFANHVRAVLGLPLGSASMRARAAAMVNVLGTGTAGAPNLRAALAVADVSVHLYGKTVNRPGRKLGHVTALGASPADALSRAQLAADRLAA
ncbi:MAG: 5-(carboxyamino)imidazole ribonucleotide synthase, partial [Chloroflexota bacterium]|nr:5-(carboxyamino)imidazole ribonucleotide synthase [Chloroflexota bacterium]